MAWRNWFDPFTTDADLANGVFTQIVIPNKNVIVRYVRTQAVFFSNPSFSTLTMKVYGNLENNVRGEHLYTSDSRTKAELITLAHGVKEFHFDFSNITLHSSNSYQFALHGVSSGLSTSSYLGWKKGFPDPVYTSGLSIGYTTPGRMPYYFYLIGSEF